MLPTDREVSWEEFKTAFRGHHIPVGILDRKLNEFLALNQGTRTVLQYAQAFNDLCQYAGYHAYSDEKKRDRFRRGLNTKLRERLNTVRADSFNELCWGLVLKCYELRTRQHKVLNVDALRPTKYYSLKD
jgi:hypothetical protein